MKAPKYIAIALGIAAVLLIAGWFLRNTIIERISNPLLAQYEVEVTDVSLDALATSDASISYLELEHANGTTFAIDELRLPIGTSPEGFRHVSAGKLTIDLPADGDDEPIDLARVMRQLLALPLQLQQTEVLIAELSVSRYPVIRDLRWQTTQNNQQLVALVDSLSLTVNVDRVSDTDYLLDLSFAGAPNGSVDHSITIDIQDTATGISLAGAASLDLSRWAPVSTLLDIDAYNIESGSATLRFDGELANDVNQAQTLYADFTPTSPVLLTYPRAPDTVTSITVESASTIEISATYPDLQWSLRQAEASLRVSDADWKDIPVSLVNLSCQSDRTCAADISIMMEDAALPFADVDRFEFAATQDVAINEDGVLVLVRPGATVDMSGVSGQDLDLLRFTGQLTAAAELNIRDAGWQLTAQSADVAIEEYSVVDNLGFTARVFLDDISFSDENQSPVVRIGAYASSSLAHLGDQLIQLPGFKGGIARQGDEVAVFLETDGLFAEAGVEASHNLRSEVGQLTVTNASLSFGSQELSSRVSPWPHDWNVSAGTLGIDLLAAWQRTGTEWRVTAQAAMRLADLAGAWDDIAFAGLSTDLHAAFDTETGIGMQPSTLQIALIEMGLPVENITADYTVHPDELSVNVENLRMNAFGGVVTADPFSFSTARERNTLLLHANSVDLAEILSVKEFEAIEISGSIGAELPVTIEGQTVMIEGGTLTGEPPGGVIRYLPGLGGDPGDASGIGIATRALSNFEYETLTSEVNYSTDGDLRLQMRLTGRNPDLEDNRPVILNFGLENNIPQMLRSLQAARAVEEILERRLAQ